MNLSPDQFFVYGEPYTTQAPMQVQEVFITVLGPTAILGGVTLSKDGRPTQRRARRLNVSLRGIPANLRAQLLRDHLITLAEHVADTERLIATAETEVS